MQRHETDAVMRRWHSLAIAPWNEWNDFRAHDTASHTAIATRLASASDIR